MACFSPLTAFQRSDGEVVFAERGDILRQLELPCGQCIGCRLERSRQWAIRCMHEAQMHRDNSFVTLTYSDEHACSSLDYSHFQKFMKRVRRRFQRLRVRFYMCGEYGEEFGRPHFHALLFGLRFPDQVYFSRSPGGAKLYTSDILSSLWPFGFSSIGDVTFESAGYVARYCMKKITGRMAQDHYQMVDDDGVVTWRMPEFSHMSLKPGIGAGWFDAFGADVFGNGKGEVVVNGQSSRAPKYYERLAEARFGEVLDTLEYSRYVESQARAWDATPERLAVRAEVVSARVSSLKRKIT